MEIIKKQVVKKLAKDMYEAETVCVLESEEISKFSDILKDFGFDRITGFSIDNNRTLRFT
jgi:hypothetical protein